jgi:hypothetical protein
MNVCDGSVRPEETSQMAIAGLGAAELIELALLLVVVGASPASWPDFRHRRRRGAGAGVL